MEREDPKQYKILKDKGIITQQEPAEEVKEAKPEIETSHTVQLAVEIGGKGGLSIEQENKLDEFNIPLTKRADDKGVIFYEIETENLDKAKETIKKLEDNKFKDVFISHAKVNPDGSTVRLSDAELYNQTGQTSYEYDPKKDAPKTVILDDEQANRLFRENFEIIEETEDAIETAKAKEQREKAEAEAKTEVVSEDPVTETEDSPKTKLQQKYKVNPFEEQDIENIIKSIPTNQPQIYTDGSLLKTKMIQKQGLEYTLVRIKRK